MSANAFAARTKAAEGQFFALEDRLAIIKRLERLVESGKIEKSLLEAFKNAGTRTEVIKARDVEVFNYKPGLVPPPRIPTRFNLGTQFSLGRSRWTTDDASIFSVADGKRLASTPVETTSAYENIRMNKIQRAAMETPTVAGYRLLPELTPGRAFFWGTILAVWATAAVVSGTARSLDIQDASDAPNKMKTLFVPIAGALERWLAPLRGTMSVAAAAGPGLREDTSQSNMVRELRTKLMKNAAA